MKHLVFTTIIVLLATTPALAQDRIVNQGQGQQQSTNDPSDVRIGMGLSTSQVDLRLEINESNALDFLLNFNLVSGNLTANNTFGIGAQFLHRLITEDSVNFHIVTGMTYGRNQGVIGGSSFTNQVSVFGGVGAEYFMTPSFSLEANVGIGLDYEFQQNLNGIRISPRSLTPGTFKLRYYF